MAHIKITPDELRNAATFLGTKNETVATMIDEIKTKIDETTANWEGASQEEFVEIFTDEMYPFLSQQLPEVLSGIAAQLNGTANAIEDADAELEKSFK